MKHLTLESILIGAAIAIGVAVTVIMYLNGYIHISTAY